MEEPGPAVPALGGIVGLESPISSESMAPAVAAGPGASVPEVSSAAQSYASRLSGMSDAARAAVMGQLRLQAPNLYSEVGRLLSSPEAATPMPQQAAPRRGASKAQI